MFQIKLAAKNFYKANIGDIRFKIPELQEKNAQVLKNKAYKHKG